MSSSFTTDSSHHYLETEVLEVEGETYTNPELAIEDDHIVRPYEGEPIADEEWIAQYRARKIAKEERLEIFGNRLKGLETLDSWCVYLI